MVGLPGLMFDGEGPSIVGMLSGVRTIIDAHGKASSTLYFRMPRLVFDNEMDSHFFKLLETTEANIVNKNLVKDFSQNYEYVYNSLLYNKKLYSGFDIGLDIYTLLLYGKIHPRKALQGLADNIMSLKSDGVNKVP